MADKEIEIKISQVTTAMMMEVWMEDRMVNDLNKYLDAKHNKDGEDFSSHLVGQISHGEQLKIDIPAFSLDSPYNKKNFH